MCIPLPNGTGEVQNAARGSHTNGNFGSHFGQFSDRYKMDWSDGKIGRRRDIAESERAEARDCSRDCREPDFLKKMMPWVLTDTFVRREGRIFGWSASR